VICPTVSGKIKARADALAFARANKLKAIERN
jgi:hypothetical protein